MSVMVAYLLTLSAGPLADFDCLNRETPEDAQACANEAYAHSIEVLREPYDAVEAMAERRDAEGLPKGFLAERTTRREFETSYSAWLNYRNETCYFEARLIDNAFYIPAAVQLCRATMNVERAEELRGFLSVSAMNSSADTASEP